MTVPLTYDLDVAAGRYFARPRRRATSRCCCCSPARCSTRATTACRSGWCPGRRRRTFRLPVAVWRDAMDAHFPGRRLGPAAPRRPGRARRLPLRERGPDLGRHGGPAAEGGRRMSGPIRFDEVAAVADAVLFEGYLLYPYRASAQKNRLRWQFGVLMPAGQATDSGEVDHQPHRVPARAARRRRDAAGPAAVPARRSAVAARRRRPRRSRSWPSGTRATSRSRRACRSRSTRS